MKGLDLIEFLHRRHLHRCLGSPVRTRTESGKDVRLRFADQPATSRPANASSRQFARSEFLVGARQRRSAIYRHKAGDSVALVYVDHHDAAYRWAERRRIEAHPTTGAIQIVEVRERVVEIAAPAQGEPLPATSRPRRLFAALDLAALLSVGVPEDWIGDVLAADEDAFFRVASHLPAEASEALLEFAATGVLKAAAKPVADPMRHPDSLRRFRVMDDVAELKVALDAPFDKWIVFLHPAQRGLVERDWTGPARVVGSAGTGKTVVALHRVLHLLSRDPHARVLLTTFSTPLAEALADKLKLMTAERAGLFERATISSFDWPRATS